MHMNQKSRLGLAALAVAVMVLLVVLFGYRERPVTGAGADAPWLPQLKQQLHEVRKLALRSSAESATLVRKGTVWGVEERAGYPADFERLEALLAALANARRVEQKTAKPEYFDRLGLSDIEKPESEAVQVEVWAAGEEPVVRVLIGRAAEGRRGRYVRAVSENETWLIDTAPEPMTGPADWLDRKLLGVDFSRVASVSRSMDGQPGFAATRASPAGDASLALAELPPGKAPRYQGVFDAAARAILTAEPEDVRKTAAADPAPAAITAIGCFDGLGIEVRAREDKDGKWVALRASAGAPVAQAPAPAAAAQDAELAPAPEKAQPDAAVVQAEAEGLNSRLSGWEFKVSDYVYGELAKGLGDYIQDEKPATLPAAPDEKP
jgi:Domain of unknown function (DUF4340)